MTICLKLCASCSFQIAPLDPAIVIHLPHPRLEPFVSCVALAPTSGEGLSRLRLILQRLKLTDLTRLVVALLNRCHPQLILPRRIHLPVARNLQLWLHVVEDAAVPVARVEEGLRL